MPLEDAFRRLLENEHIDPQRHAFIVHPSDLNRLSTFINGNLMSESLLTDRPPWVTFRGIQIFSSPHIPPGQVTLFQRSLVRFQGPASSWVHVAADVRAQLPRPIQPGAGGLPGGDGAPGVIILEEHPAPKSFWELLDEADD